MSEDASQACDRRSAHGAPDRRLSRNMRIAQAKVFRDAFAAGRGRAGRYMVLWLGRGSEACLRLGVVASKRSFRRAVDRARAKRLLREAFRLNRFRFTGPSDVILLARPAIGKARCADVEKDLLDLARKVGLMARDAGGK